MAYGNVYVFNLYGSAATQVNINGQGSAGSIGAPVKGTASPPGFYAAPQLVVGRSNLTPDQLNDPLFCNGPNTIKINYDGYSWNGTITIPPASSMPLQNDLWLYLAYGQMFLFNTSGTIIPQPGGGGLQATKGGGGGKSDSAPLTKQRGGVSAKATVKLSSGGAKGGAKGGASKGGASKKGAKKSAKKG
jgi:hypothetical protein